jgi:pseudouridine-5'-phosphate glycosidase
MNGTVPLDVRPEVSAALQAGHPVVALTSAPIGHSLPWPKSLEIARLAEAAVRQGGAIPAFVAVWQGRLTVGLTAGELDELSRGASALRASRRDLATAVARRLTAATTVSASMYLAHRAGIRLLAASAVGGASSGTGDVSADLLELSRTPVAIITAGARTVADLARTSEILESYAVPIVGYGTDSFPAFYQRPGSQPASVRADKPAELAALLAAHWGLGGAGVVVAQPTPDAVALFPDEVQPALREVSHQAARGGVGTRDLPPVLMDRLNRMTGGRALQAYQAILEANARLAAQLARELAGFATHS